MFVLKQGIPHFLYGYVNCKTNYSVTDWLFQIKLKLIEIKKLQKIPILVGGTGLYFHSLINGLVKIPNIPIKIRKKIRLLHKKFGQKIFYKKLLKLDPKIKNKFDKNDVQRSLRAFEIKKHTRISMYDWLKKTKVILNENNFVKFYIDINRKDLIKRIEKRTDQMIKDGALKEVKKFNKLKIKSDHSINKVIGINELNRYLKKEISLEVAKELIIIKTRQYAKRQSTWARSKMNSWTKIDPLNSPFR